MASVRMSGELRNRIFENFKRQIYKVYEDNSGLQDYLKSIMESFYSVEERELMSDYMELHERLFRMKYPKFDHEKFSPKKYFGSYKVFSTEEKLFEDISVEDYKFKGYIDIIFWEK